MPQCRHVAVQPSCPDVSEPRTWPRRTRAPAPTAAVTGSYVDRSPPGWSTDTTGLPATRPANTTVPSATARTEVPSAAARSTPRWPGSQSCSGRSNGVTTRGCGRIGHANESDSAAAAGVVSTTAARTQAMQPVRRVFTRRRWPVNVLENEARHELWTTERFVHRHRNLLTVGPGYDGGRRRSTLLVAACACTGRLRASASSYRLPRQSSRYENRLSAVLIPLWFRSDNFGGRQGRGHRHSASTEP